MASDVRRSSKVGKDRQMECDVISSYHVISRTGRWSVKRSGAQRAARVFASQPEAVEYAVKMATPAAAEVVVHKQDGSVAERIRPKVRSLTR
jgi:hypothetical protein